MASASRRVHFRRTNLCIYCILSIFVLVHVTIATFIIESSDSSSAMVLETRSLFVIIVDLEVVGTCIVPIGCILLVAYVFSAVDKAAIILLLVRTKCQE